MGSIFTYLYDKTLYWKYEHIVAGEKICPKRQCVTKDDGEDMYTVIRDDFHARYIFVDEYPLVGTERVLKTPSFIKLLKADGRFKQAFVDGEHPSVKVYKLL
jgi:hypothetical protein